MKRMVCEMCGGTDLIKQDGVFVCQSCGTKYSVEDAKKMMVEIDGTVEVTGTVKVDTTESVKNYLNLAWEAYTSIKTMKHGFCEARPPPGSLNLVVCA